MQIKISTKGRYGLRAMYELAFHRGDAPIPLKNIAQSQDISEQYLEQLMLSLRRSGLIISIRGAQGGYALAKSPEDITVGDVLRVLEGPIGFVDCALEGDDASCERSELCIARPVWEKLRDSMIRAVDSITLQELCEQGHGKNSK